MTFKSVGRVRRAVVAAIVITAGVAGGAALAQDRKQHRVVFEVTTDDAQVWQGVLNNVENLQKALGTETTEIRVIAHGKGLGLVMKTDTAQAERIAALANPRVKFLACENTMRRMQVSKEDLLPAAGTVDSGVAEVVRLQEAGYSYIKSGS